jgi:ribosomal protein S8
LLLVRARARVTSALTSITLVRATIFVIRDTYVNARYTLYTDAYGFVVRVVLLQDQGQQRVVHRARKINKHDVHYYVREQELLAVRDALLKFYYCLNGAAGFMVITDRDTLRQSFLSTARFV